MFFSFEKSSLKFPLIPSAKGVSDMLYGEGKGGLACMVHRISLGYARGDGFHKKHLFNHNTRQNGTGIFNLLQIFFIRTLSISLCLGNVSKTPLFILQIIVCLAPSLFTTQPYSFKYRKNSSRFT